MVHSAQIIGSGRVGSAVHERLAERGVRLGDAEPELVLLCVPDDSIAEVAATIARGPWVCHLSGAVRLTALAPHEEQRFSVHPLTPFVLGGGATQFDGAYAAVSGESEQALQEARELALLLGLKPFQLDDQARPLYHAAAALAANHLVTLERLAAPPFSHSGAPPEALIDLLRRTLAAGLPRSGPLARGDLQTLAAHREALQAYPDALKAYETLNELELGLEEEES